MVVARKLPQCAVAISAKLDEPFVRREHFTNQLGNVLVVLNVQNADLGSGSLRPVPYDLPLDFPGLGE